MTDKPVNSKVESEIPQLIMHHCANEYPLVMYPSWATSRRTINER